jgi:hypothetical protein
MNQDSCSWRDWKLRDYGVIATPRIDSLRARLLVLESSGGYVTLDDGTKFRPKDSGIRMLFNATKLRRDLGRETLLSVFPETSKRNGGAM